MSLTSLVLFWFALESITLTIVLLGSNEVQAGV